MGVGNFGRGVGASPKTARGQDEPSRLMSRSGFSGEGRTVRVRGFGSGPVSFCAPCLPSPAPWRDDERRTAGVGVPPVARGRAARRVAHGTAVRNAAVPPAPRVSRLAGDVSRGAAVTALRARIPHATACAATSSPVVLPRREATMSPSTPRTRAARSSPAVPARGGNGEAAAPLARCGGFFVAPVVGCVRDQSSWPERSAPAAARASSATASCFRLRA
jgi:hypothetical protein